MLPEHFSTHDMFVCFWHNHTSLLLWSDLDWLKFVYQKYHHKIRHCHFWGVFGLPLVLTICIQLCSLIFHLCQPYCIDLCCLVIQPLLDGSVKLVLFF